MASFEGAEAEVVGAILLAGILGPDSGWAVYDRAETTGLTPDHFWRASYGYLFCVIGDMRRRRIPVDPLAVSVELEGLDAPDHVRARLETLARSTPAFSLIEHRCQLVLDAAIARGIRELRT